MSGLDWETLAKDAKRARLRARKAGDDATAWRMQRIERHANAQIRKLKREQTS